MHRRFTRRHSALIEKGLVRQFGAMEWLETLASSLRLDRLAWRINHRANRYFAERVVDLMKREPVEAIWGFDTASLQTFRWAKSRGIFCVLDRTTIHGKVQNRILAEEYERHPDYFRTERVPKSGDLLAEEDEEIALADMVVTGSPYCAQTLVENGCDPKKIRIINYGYDDNLFPQQLPHRAPVGARPIKFLFVGGINPLKGMAYLLEAFEQIDPKDATLTLVGEMHLPPAVFERFAGRLTHIPSLPRAEVVRHYCEADCLIFPSLLEGSSIVLREALGAGLGGVQTRVAGEGFLPGIDGLQIRPGSKEDILEAVRLIVKSPRLVDEWSRAAWGRRGTASWSVYRNKVRGAIAEALA